MNSWNTRIPYYTQVENFDPSSAVEGTYTDPNHPGGYRKISFTDDAGDLDIEVIDKPNGKLIMTKGYALFIDGKINIKMDLSPKGGPDDLLGIYDNDNIYFTDGNSWTKLIL